MNFNIREYILLFMLQYALALDDKNCSNAFQELFVHTARNPKMKFYLFTNKNFYNEQEIFLANKTSLINSNFNKSNPTRILVHGWKNSLQSCFNGYIKDAYLQKGDFNVFVIDWSDWSRSINYLHVAKLILGKLGKLLGDFTKFLNSEGKVSFDDMYLVGHSLGAHMSGAAGKSIKPNQYNTIFGLDPAGPEFFTAKEDDRLSLKDAKYVEQISTNMGELGYLGVLGHSAFFPNFGRVQAYCLLHLLDDVGCSHGAAFAFFAESINSKIGFCGQECPFYWNLYFFFKCSCKCANGKEILMGGEPSVPKNGTYYIDVNFKPPFAKCGC